jgi:hypothetical protein
MTRGGGDRVGVGIEVGSGGERRALDVTAMGAFRSGVAIGMVRVRYIYTFSTINCGMRGVCQDGRVTAEFAVDFARAANGIRMRFVTSEVQA